jgi:hypothetical protein
MLARGGKANARGAALVLASRARSRCAVRRTTPNCSFVAEEQRKLLASLAGLDPAAIARTLEEFVQPARAARLRAVFAARLEAVTVVMDAPHDPHNGAAVIRSSDAFGVHRIHVVERIERFLAANSVARGSERWVDVRTHETVEAAVAALVCPGTSSSRPIPKATSRQPTSPRSRDPRSSWATSARASSMRCAPRAATACAFRCGASPRA